MPLDRFLSDIDVTPEQRHVIELAFKSTLRNLNLIDRSDPVCEIVARKVIEIGTNGVSNAVAISEIAYKQLNPRE
ncbi:hypothetical protein XH98_19785 [Bradyrhizobium sp. CCBAU 51745]|uniref:hypothetical protein n=1 Tax=Bradyrhizobium sp. CCBAU 51745 TaxID=1325099 RepID=UPI0023066151|nr:hypothetical protein [Bradyrhizobium sp. CCBAU 51745]MDA9441293.1 hypothetical protein [Bradyrhizobium sp. CCBAU 51745]